MLVAEDIEDKLELICDPNSYKEGRIYLKEYDLIYDKSGAIFNSKEVRYFYEVLYNHLIYFNKKNRVLIGFEPKLIPKSCRNLAN